MAPDRMRRAYPDARPFTRWWWFSGPVREEDVTHQLDWLKDNGFGGVEIAWIYPLPGGEKGAPLLSDAWAASVAFAKRQAEARGLGCDFTFGSLWPFGGPFVDEADASKTFRGPSKQRLHRSWDEPHAPPGPVLDHLDARALARYDRAVGAALRNALQGRPSALFCDSWEVDPEGLWTDGFGESFRERFGYDLLPLMEEIHEHPEARFDYRAHLADAVLDGFYRPFTALCGKRGALSRVQCHGAPTDLVAAYAACDVPESEAILFDPPFSAFAASAASLEGKPLVSAESFTCLYGWVPHPGPGPFQGREQTADLKLLADALLANGVNFIVWHGMPFNPPGGANRFYASVHLGPDAGFARDLPAFNGYITRVCEAMRRGRTRSALAVCLPLEDAWMRNELPQGLRRPSARCHWELQELRFPEETLPFRPLWIGLDGLRRARAEGGRLRAGAMLFDGLYIDCAWLRRDVLAEIVRLAEEGVPMVLKRTPAEPGRAKHDDFDSLRERLVSRASADLRARLPGRALAEGEDLPEFWCREDGDETLFFFAHPLSRTLRYPMRYGQALAEKTLRLRLLLRAYGRGIPVELDFPPGVSRLVRVTATGDARVDDLGFVPEPPATAEEAR